MDTELKRKEGLPVILALAPESMIQDEEVVISRFTGTSHGNSDCCRKKQNRFEAIQNLTLCSSRTRRNRGAVQDDAKVLSETILG